MTFYLELVKLPSFHLNSCQKEESIVLRKHLKEHAQTFTFQHHFKIVFKLFSNCHHVQLKSYIGPSLMFDFFARLVIPPFKMASNIISLMLGTKLGLPHPTSHGLSQCICSQPIDTTRIHLFWGRTHYHT